MTTRRNRGQSLVETALILVAFMALILGMVLVAQTLFVRQTYSGRVHAAARWAAVNGYEPQAIRNIVQYGSSKPTPGATAFMGLTASQIVIANSGCPGTQCRVVVAIPSQGIGSTEPIEPGQAPISGALPKP